MKHGAKGKRVSGIGHRIKSADNMDKRVLIMRAYAQEHFPHTDQLNYALEVEQYTLSKASNLVLNVDGAIANIFLDLMRSCAAWDEEEIDEVVEMGQLNGLFVLARTIGLCGHWYDQVRLKGGLYRYAHTGCRPARGRAALVQGCLPSSVLNLIFCGPSFTRNNNRTPPPSWCETRRHPWDDVLYTS